jgi:hypothetical protein
MGLALAVLFPNAPINAAENLESVRASTAQNSPDLLNGAPGAQFVHTATAANISSNWTDIDHPLTNGNPNAIVFVTQNWNPGDTSGQYNDHSIGVWYNNGTGKWAIFNQDIAPMPEGADFNVFIPTVDSSVFVHTASLANITSNWTEIDHPLTNDNPNAIVFVTQNYNPGGIGGQYNDHEIGVWYNTTTGRWAIFNQDIANMPAGVDFNVFIPTSDSSVFVHSATVSNITSNWTEIDHPLTNGNPNAIVHVTQNWNPGGTSGQYNNNSIGVWYNNSTGRWAIFNQDFFVDMPEGVDFNVIIPALDSSVFVHTASADNISLNWTVIDHPLTNDNPNAIVHVTQNWNPAGTGGQYNNHSIGVWYISSSGRWAIFNQDIAGMPEGVDFNVSIPTVDSSVFVHAATAANITSNWTEIDHPLTNDNPNSIVFVTQNWNPGDTSGEYNDHSIGVWYNSSTGRWAIFNQDITNMPDGVDFNVSVFEGKFLTFLPLTMRVFEAP